jgi:hypothetical protein
VSVITRRTRTLTHPTDRKAAPDRSLPPIVLPAVPSWARRSAALLGWFFAGAGVMRLLPVPFDLALFEGWGLTTEFRAAVGVAELTVGALALNPRTRPIGLIGIGVVMVSAGTVHAVLGHLLVVAVLVNGSLAAAAFATAWALRAEVIVHDPAYGTHGSDGRDGRGTGAEVAS